MNTIIDSIPTIIKLYKLPSVTQAHIIDTGNVIKTPTKLSFNKLVISFILLLKIIIIVKHIIYLATIDISLNDSNVPTRTDRKTGTLYLSSLHIYKKKANPNGAIPSIKTDLLNKNPIIMKMIVFESTIFESLKLLALKLLFLILVALSIQISSFVYIELYQRRRNYFVILGTQNQKTLRHLFCYLTH